MDGEIIHRQGTIVTDSSSVELTKEAIEYQNNLITILINKPLGYVSGQPEKGYKPAVSLITPKNRYTAPKTRPQKIKWPIKKLAPAGRLDIDSTGLLVFSQDGRIPQKLIAINTDIEKEYLVRINRPILKSHLQRLEHGLVLDGVELKHAQIDVLDKDYIRMILRQGRKRQIRRMCSAVGLQVVKLKRVRIGNVSLGSLPTGKWRTLEKDENF